MEALSPSAGFQAEPCVPSSKTLQEICGLQIRISVFFVCRPEAESKRFPGLSLDIRTLQRLWRSILCEAAYGLDSLRAASSISKMVRSANRIHPPMGLARA